MFKKKYLLMAFILALFLLIPAGVLADDGGDDETAQDHEVCQQYLKFKHSSNNNTLAWGTMMLCSPQVNDIFVEAELQYLASWGAYVWMADVDRTCRTYLCIAQRTYSNPPAGTWRVKYCARASSPTSDWPYACRYETRTISDEE